jgi:hypothetical protein
MQRSIWVFDGKGAKVIHQSSISSSTVNMASIFHMKLSFYPLAVFIDQGILVGLQQHLTLNTMLDISQFGIEMKTSLFVHLIVKHMLSQQFENEAYQFVSYFCRLEYFNHILEVLLHIILEEDGPDNCIVIII